MVGVGNPDGNLIIMMMITFGRPTTQNHPLPSWAWASQAAQTKHPHPWKYCLVVVVFVLVFEAIVYSILNYKGLPQSLWAFARDDEAIALRFLQDIWAQYLESNNSNLTQKSSLSEVICQIRNVTGSYLTLELAHIWK